MIRVIIICEGETERDFCRQILAPYFLTKKVLIQAPLIKKSQGGIVKWMFLKKQISLHLLTEPNSYVTTFIDYYGLSEGHKFPSWDEAEVNSDKYQRMTLLEKGMKDDLKDNISHRFIPYVQLHEFEGLLFINIESFIDNIPKEDLVGMEELKTTFKEYDNPEMINNSRETSPSHRLERIIRGYNKIVHGVILAEVISLNEIRSKCLHFNSWIEMIEGLGANCND